MAAEETGAENGIRDEERSGGKKENEGGLHLPLIRLQCSGDVTSCPFAVGSIRQKVHLLDRSHAYSVQMPESSGSTNDCYLLAGNLAFERQFIPTATTERLTLVGGLSLATRDTKISPHLHEDDTCYLIHFSARKYIRP